MKKIIIAIVALLFISTLPIHQVEALPTTVSVSVVSYFDSTNTVTTTVTNQTYGTRVAFISNLTSESGYEFAFWVVNNVVRKDLPPNYQFMVTDNLEVKGIFKPTDQYVVVFLDANGKMLKVEHVVSEESATPPSYATLDKPGYIVDSEAPWVDLTFATIDSFSSITQDIVAILNYEPSDTPSTFSLYVTNGTADGTVDEPGQYSYNFGEVASLTPGTAPEGKSFSHWAIGTRVVSRNQNFKVTIMDDTYYTAVFMTTPLSNAPLINLSDATKTLRAGYVSFKGQFYLPSGHEIVEYGIVTHSDYKDVLDLDTAGAIKRRSNKYNAETNEFLMSFDDSSVKSAVAYFVTKNGESITTTYSGISLNNNKNIVISEVYGGGGNSGATYKNDFIELYNPTSKPVSLEGWSVQYASATGNTWQLTILTGTIKPYSYYLIQQAAGTNDAPLLPTPDATETIPMSATAGKVILTNQTSALSGTQPSSNVIDLVGFGSTANYYEGSGPTPAPSNTTSVSRKQPFYDTNQNATDFVAGAPTPKNSSYGYWS